MKKRQQPKSITNRNARFKYHLSDFHKAGIVLKGTEIKSLRAGNADLSDAYVTFRHGEAFLINAYIAPYDKGNIHNHEPRRERKLLLRKREIRRLAQEVEKAGKTVVPTKIFFDRGLAKLEIAVGTGKKLHDKREAIKERDQKRAIEQRLKEGRYND